MIVQTVFIDGERWQALVDDSIDGPLAMTPDGKLIVASRPAVARDWADGVFVGDHECEDEHVHGEP